MAWHTYAMKLLPILLSFMLIFLNIFLWPLQAEENSVFPHVGLILPTVPMQPVMVKGLTVYPDEPFQFDLIVEPNTHTDINGESLKMAKYFLACLTIPEKEMWVNLSPYEKDHIVPEALGQTLLGKDMLVQDYVLKQMASSLMHPDTTWGKDFWKKVYAQTKTLYGDTGVPVNTFNKVWIIPDQATVWEHGKSVFIIERHLKVIGEKDYLALEKNVQPQALPTVEDEVLRDIIIPQLEREVNEGAHFAQLRQIYNAMILATWYKKKLKDTLLAKAYVDQHKTQGIGGELVDNKMNIEKIYQQYLTSVQKGVFNLIKEDPSEETGEVIPHKYFAGGIQAVGEIKVIVGQRLMLKPIHQANLPSDAAMAVKIKGYQLKKGSSNSEFKLTRAQGQELQEILAEKDMKVKAQRTHLFLKQLPNFQHVLRELRDKMLYQVDMQGSIHYSIENEEEIDIDFAEGKIVVNKKHTYYFQSLPNEMSYVDLFELRISTQRPRPQFVWNNLKSRKKLQLFFKRSWDAMFKAPLPTITVGDLFKQQGFGFVINASQLFERRFDIRYNKEKNTAEFIEHMPGRNLSYHVDFDRSGHLSMSMVLGIGKPEATASELIVEAHFHPLEDAHASGADLFMGHQGLNLILTPTLKGIMWWITDYDKFDKRRFKANVTKFTDSIDADFALVTVISPITPGGIDMNSDKLNLKIKGKMDTAMTINPTESASIIVGLEPKILRIEPVNLLELTGP